jgi:SpoVK/Ycf46/Vps4 family AAA+-type ATPase
MLRDLCATLKTSRKNVILLSPVVQIPIELSKEMAVLTVPLPTRDEIQDLLHKVEPDAQIEAVEASLGLTREEIENVYAKSIVKHGKIKIDEVLSEKRQIVQKAGLLEFVNITGDFDEVGGLENLKSWLIKRKKGFTAEARALNLPAPKGLLLVGLPGCGKSLTAFCTGAAWKMPLLRLDMGKIFSGLVGSSEANIRLAISTAESVAPCILWIDEIEKGMGGGQGGDGGTTSRVFGSFLTWMQEKKAPVFVLATANDISALPPEMLRKGRFDEIFFVDTPRAAERLTILDIHLKKRSWLIEKFCPDTFTDKTDQFTGAEIEQALIDAAYDAYFVGENLHMTHLETALIRTVPLAKTMKEKISSIRSWAQDRAVPAARSEIMHSQKMRVLER